MDHFSVQTHITATASAQAAFTMHVHPRLYPKAQASFSEPHQEFFLNPRALGVS